MCAPSSEAPRAIIRNPLTTRQGDEVQLLTDNSLYETYKSWSNHFFGGEQPCDMCGPYFQPTDVFKEGCQDGHGHWQMHGRKDMCSVCNGGNECFGCDGKRDSGKQWNRCGTCTDRNDTSEICKDKCAEQRYPAGYELDTCLNCVPAGSPRQGPCPWGPSPTCNMHGVDPEEAGQGCQCFDIYEGDYCETCKCMHGGTCNASGGRHVCNCPTISAASESHQRRLCAREGQRCKCTGIVGFGAEAPEMQQLTLMQVLTPSPLRALAP